MEFATLSFTSPSQQTPQSTATTGAAPSPGTLQTNPENVVTPAAEGDAARAERRADALGRQSSVRSADAPGRADDDGQLTSRRTTLNFDAEQNRVFLEVIDTNTDEVIERIPPDELVEFIARALETNTGTRSTAGEREPVAPVDRSV